MRKLAWLVPIVVLAGCSSDETPKTPTASPVKPPAATIDVPVPALLERPSLFLVAEDGRRLGLGTSEKDALSFFPKPAGAADVREVPSVFGNQLTAAGWESKNGGFAILLRENSAVLAIRTIENVSKGVIDDLKTTYSDAISRRIKPTEIGDEEAGYKFWIDGTTQLMVVWSKDLKSHLSISVALGTAPVMHALRMDEASAVQDLATMKRQTSEKPGK